MQSDYTLDELKQMVIDNDWSAFTLRWGYVFFKKFDNQVTEDDIGYVKGAEVWIYDPTTDESEENDLTEGDIMDMFTDGLKDRFENGYEKYIR